jgi:toxin ParE1/3/4
VVKWTTPAKLDLKEIHDYIARDSKFYAQKISLEIVEKSKKLNSFPPTDRCDITEQRNRIGRRSIEYY